MGGQDQSGQVLKLFQITSKQSKIPIPNGL